MMCGWEGIQFGHPGIFNHGAVETKKMPQYVGRSDEGLHLMAQREFKRIGGHSFDGFQHSFEVDLFQAAFAAAAFEEKMRLSRQDLERCIRKARTRELYPVGHQGGVAWRSIEGFAAEDVQPRR